MLSLTIGNGWIIGTLSKQCLKFTLTFVNATLWQLPSILLVALG
jgi:hypothetical protein